MPVKRVIFFIFLWSLSVTVLMAGLMLTHSAPLSAYAVSSKESGRWTIQHILSSDCACSKKVVEELIARSAESDRTEQVYLLKDDYGWSEALKQKGFAVQVMALEEQKRLGESQEDFGVPALVIFTPNGERVYVGGYSEGVLSSGAPNREREIVSHFIFGTAARHFPIRGCAVTASYQRKIDPFSFKYKVAGDKNE